MFTRDQFIENIKDEAINSCKGTGLFPSLMIAQAILESGTDDKGLEHDAFNFFGIKAIGGWKGKTVLKPTREVIDGKSITINAAFRKYGSIGEGFLDRNKFLKENPRYAKAGVFTAKTPEDQARAFQAAGYATDPKYAQLLISVINGSSNLKQYDK